MSTTTGRRILMRRATEQDFAALDALYYATHEYHVAGVPERIRVVTLWQRRNQTPLLAGPTRYFEV